MNNMYTSNISHFFLYKRLPAVVACNVADGNVAVAITGVVVNAVLIVTIVVVRLVGWCNC
jgi:hypothetical protein